MKFRLYAGGINAHPDEDGWRNFTLDVNPRPVWDPGIRMAVLPDFIGDIADLSQFRAGTFDEVVCSHVLEHLALDHAKQALRAMHRVLKPNGSLIVEVPDVGKVCKAWVYDELDHAGLCQWLYGEQLPDHDPADSHRWGWTEQQLAHELSAAGFTPGSPVEAGYAARFHAVKR